MTVMAVRSCPGDGVQDRGSGVETRTAPGVEQCALPGWRGAYGVEVGTRTIKPAGHLLGLRLVNAEGDPATSAPVPAACLVEDGVGYTRWARP